MSRCAVVTGASSGFGWAIAETLARDGWHVVAVGRRSERLQKLAESLSGYSVHTEVLDVRNAELVASLPERLPRPFDSVGLLVNNAGLANGFGKLHENDLDEWQTMVDTNVSGLVRVTRAFLPVMIARNSGQIVNISSVAGTYPYPGGNVYGATKAFVTQFSLNLRADLLGTNVRVTSIEPGMAETEFSLVRFGGDAHKAAAVYRGVNSITAADIAEMVRWIADQPGHLNINRLEVMPVQQAFGPFAVHRDGS